MDDVKEELQPDTVRGGAPHAVRPALRGPGPAGGRRTGHGDREPRGQRSAARGNASLTGSYMALISRTHRQRQLVLARRLTYIDLSNDPGFMDQYTAALFLPHTDLGRFPSAARVLGTTGR